jgi:hypothetical protein
MIQQPILTPREIAQAIGITGSDGKIDSDIMRVYTFSIPAITGEAGGSIAVNFSPAFKHVPVVVPISGHRTLHLGAESVSASNVSIGYYCMTPYGLNATTAKILVYDTEYAFGGGGHNKCSPSRRRRPLRSYHREGVAA